MTENMLAPDDDASSTPSVDVDAHAETVDREPSPSEDTADQSHLAMAGPADVSTFEADGATSDADMHDTVDPFGSAMPPPPKPYLFGPDRLGEVAKLIDTVTSNLELPLYTLASGIGTALETTDPALVRNPSARDHPRLPLPDPHRPRIQQDPGGQARTGHDQRRHLPIPDAS